MTMPHERTRATLQTRAFLEQLATLGPVSGSTESIRQEARRLLRHFPRATDLQLAHLACPQWFGAATPESTTPGGLLTGFGPLCDESVPETVDRAVDQPRMFEDLSGRTFRAGVSGRITVAQLMALLSKQDQAATVVVCDRTEFLRIGLVRPLMASELEAVQLGEVTDEEGSWLCAWNERPNDGDCRGPLAGLLLGPP